MSYNGEIQKFVHLRTNPNNKPRGKTRGLIFFDLNTVYNENLSGSKFIFFKGGSIYE